VQLAIGKQKSIADQQGNLVFPARQIEGILRFITNEVHAHQPGVNIQAINPHRVIVIEEHRRILLIGVIEGGGLSRDVPVLRVAVAVGRCFASMKVNHAADFRQVRFGAMNGVVDGQKMLLGQLIDPLDHQSMAAASFERRPREG
jgi:hypothetical protein